MVTLHCLLVGAVEGGSAFAVDIDEDKSVGHLKNAIKAKLPNSIKCSASQLRLYLAMKGDDHNKRWLTENEVIDAERAILDGLTPLRPLQLLRSVELSEAAVAAKAEDKDQYEDGVLHVVAMVPETNEPPSPPPLAVVSKKRKLAEMKDWISSPSCFTQCRGPGSWVKWLKKFRGQLECHRVFLDEDDDKIPPLRLVLLNETFATFEQNCKTLPTENDDYYLFVEDLRDSDSTEDLIDLRVTPVAKKDFSYRVEDTLLVNVACRLQKGDDGDGCGGDPTMQSVAVYLNSLPTTGVNRAFPCLLLNFCGPLLSVFGIVNTSDQDAVCEPLTLSVPLLFFENESMMVSLARVCGALKRAVQELTERETVHFHQKTSSRGHGPPAERVRWRFPYEDSIQMDTGNPLSFQYLQAIQKYVFEANIPKDDGTKPVIVKFAKRYGAQVHLHCEKAGFAPALLGWELRKIQRALQEAAFVHGDSRDCNVQWDPEMNRVVLIDFDWAGQDHVATYPPFMNSEITWPPGAECGEPLRLAHDAHWLNSLVRWHARE